MSHKTLPAIALALLMLTLTVWTRPGVAQSQSPDTTVESLKGETVAIFFRGLPFSGKREVIQVHGEVNAATEHGLWLKPTMRYFKNNSEEKYKGPVYLPWTSIGYVKVLR